MIPFIQHPALPQGFSASFPKRFWARVNKDGPTPEHLPELGPCWIWTGPPDASGYGRIGCGLRTSGTMKANRASWLLVFGEIPEGQNVLHKCDNPACVRPEHLFLGSHSDNIKDMMAKGRHGSNADAMRQLHAEGNFRLNPRKGESHPAAKLSDEMVKELHAYRSSGHTTRDTASRFGVSQAAVIHIGKGRTWKHLGLHPS